MQEELEGSTSFLMVGWCPGDMRNTALSWGKVGRCCQEWVGREEGEEERDIRMKEMSRSVVTSVWGVRC
jgi:hypothetical protein